MSLRDVWRKEVNGIAKRYINLPLFERGGVILILDTHEQLFRRDFCHFAQSKFLILNSLRPIPPASYQCTSAM